MKALMNHIEMNIIPAALIFILFVIVKDEKAYKRIKEKKVFIAIYIAIICYCISLVVGFIKFL
ncbi:hypothetical protein [Treponema socranskii]|uniref:hypothetical protein n=1 Tax=Treponema socranskii TaxID=53419 RepID=UPI003D6E48B3